MNYFFTNLKTFKKNLSITLITIIIIMPITSVLYGCNSNIYLESPVTVSDFKLNTYVSVSSYTTGGHSTNELKNILSSSLDICDKYENIFSRTLPNSDLYALNSNNQSVVCHELGELIEKGIEYGRISDGAFDISIGSISSLWDFTTDNPSVPDKDLITKALTYVDYTKIQLSANEDGTYTVSMPDEYTIDLGAIAQGYIADQIKSFLISNNINNAIINLGGNVLCIGNKKEDKNFAIAIRKPFAEDNSTLMALDINDLSVVSSGNYERYFIQDGKLYHHILNPKTGYPYDNNIKNVTIISKDSLTGDCLSTTCFALGIDKSLELINSMSDVECMFLTNDDEFIYSDGFEQYIIK